MDTLVSNATSSGDPGADSPWSLGHVSSVGVVVLVTLSSVLLGAALRPPRFSGVKGPKPMLLLGNMVEFLRLGPIKCLTQWEKEFGDVFKIRLGLKEILVVADPELVKEVAVKKFKVFRNRPGPDELPRAVQNGIVLGRDKYWSTARGASLPWFHNKEHLEAYLPIMTQVVDRMTSDVGNVAEGAVMDLHERLQTLTLDVFCCAAFGSTLDDYTDSKAAEVSKAIADATAAISVPTVSSILALFLPVPLAKLVNMILSYIPGTREWSGRCNISTREHIGLQLLSARLQEEEAGGSRQDVLTQLLRTQAKAKSLDVKLSHRELMFVLGELILAGSDTTSNTISFAIFLLSTHPDIERRVVHEIDELYDRSPPTSVENVDKYKLVTQVVKETLRLFPIGSQLFREAMEDTSVGDVAVPRGSQIMFPLWLMHRNASHFPEPDTFNPDRFDAESLHSNSNNMKAYLPFGDGPRMCMGARFAMQEAALVLISLYRRFSFKMVGKMANLYGQDALAEFPVDSGVIMKPKEGVKVEVLRRA